ncbi:MAG: 4-hydroxythreonine-4-phosphate dehydrogenase PdxA [candidate division Zixibacteria bacterium]|nr:4-hydroxythreonine-4-phosphate dehydrogenase PdxA [candidate division Zixibacteria bacterium]
MSSKPIIGITMGDPAGIGPEVVVKAVTDKKVTQVCHPLIFGSYHIIFSAAKKFLKKTTIRKIVWPEDVRDSKDSLNVLACTKLDHSRIKTGKITKLSGRMAADSVFCATQFALSDQIDAMVTAPLSKKGLHLSGYDFPGHTELLAYLTATRNYAMMFVSVHDLLSTVDRRPSTEKYKLVLVTTHLPLSEVARIISKKKILEKLMVTQEALKKYFGAKKPKIGVCALNPHCGEEGILGSEEKKIIIPAIKAAQKIRIKAYGPFSSDTIFSPKIAVGFDCILAMYHDQGLIPLKMRGLGEAVNVTIGLPIIRTSPDFGTALDIAGKGKADPKGMTNAILLAAQMVRKTKGK